MSVYSQKEMELLSQPLPARVFSFSQPAVAPRGSSLPSEQTRKQIPSAPEGVCRGIFR